VPNSKYEIDDVDGRRKELRVKEKLGSSLGVSY